MAKYQVIIVGGGPVGVGLAVELGQRGISTALVERHLTPQRIPKGQSLQNRTLEHFYFWHCVDELRAARIMPEGYPIGGLGAYDNLMSDYVRVAGELRGDRPEPFYFQKNDRLPQYLTEEVLRERLKDLPSVKRMFGRNVKGFSQDEDGVKVEVADEGWPYDEETLEGEYVVGCDGGRSMVREKLGIERHGADFHRKMVLAIFESEGLHEGLKKFPERTTYSVIHPDLSGGRYFFGRVEVGRTWFFHSPVPDDANPENYDFAALIERAAGFEFPITFEHIGFFELRIAVADTYRVGRAFIAGDAAHTHPPYGGFGLNSGLEDITNLGWKLAAKLDGWGGETLLDSYSLERQPVFAETGEQQIAVGIRRAAEFAERYSPEKDKAEFEKAWAEMNAGEGGPPQPYDVHYEGSPVVMGPPDTKPGIRGGRAFSAKAGHHLPPYQLSSGRNVYEELGQGFTLIALDAPNEPVQALTDAATALKLPLKVLRDSFEDERKAYETRLVLVRPDQMIAWAGDELPLDATALLRKVTGSA